MSAIGGYFGLELRDGAPYHPGAYALNTGRNALALALRVGAWKKVHVPDYTCAVVQEAIRREGVDLQVHPVGDDLEMMLDPAMVGTDEVVLLTAYFGVHRPDTERWKAAKVQLMLDASLSFYEAPLSNGPTIYSCRKFFGVPDGAYLVWPGGGMDSHHLPLDSSADRFAHLLKRIDSSAEAGYPDYQHNESLLAELPVCRMSKITEALMASVDHDSVKQKRRANFEVLHRAFGTRNDLRLDRWYSAERVPMVYPLLCDAPGAIERLREQRIYIARYWPEVLHDTPSASFAHRAASTLLALPVDQRYTLADMSRLIDQVELSLR